jgi:hypothetical protein
MAFIAVRVLVFAVFPRVLMVLRLGAGVVGGFTAFAMQMPMDVLMGVFVGMDHIIMPVFMTVGVGMLMDMQMCMFGDFFHGNLPQAVKAGCLRFPALGLQPPV